MSKKSEVHWFITGRYGIYYGSNSRTRRGAIADHIESMGIVWTKCQENGDRVIKATIKELK